MDFNELFVCFDWLEGSRRAGFILHAPNVVHVASLAGRFDYNHVWFLTKQF